METQEKNQEIFSHLVEWYTKTSDLEIKKKEIKQLREEIKTLESFVLQKAFYFISDQSFADGEEHFQLPDNYQLSVIFSQDYKITKDNNDVVQALDRIKNTCKNGVNLAHSLITWKPSISNSKIEKLKEENPQAYSILCDILQSKTVAKFEIERFD